MVRKSKREIERRIERLESELERVGAENEIDPDRSRAILTKRERKYYAGEDVVGGGTQAERSLRQNVRNRVVHAILDCCVLMEMEDRDRERISQEISDEDIDVAIKFLGSLKD